MKIRAGLLRKSIALFLTAGITLLSLSGCQYESFDDYLEALGIKNPDYDDSNVQDLNDADDAQPEETYSLEDETQNVSEPFESDDTVTITSDEEALFLDESTTDAGALEDDDTSSQALASNSSFTKEDIDARAAVGLTDDQIPALKQKQSGRYYYERLTDSGKLLYVELLAIMENLGENICISTTNDKAVELVFDYLMADHPEIFYVDGYQYTNYTLGDTVTKMSFTGNYIYDANEIARRQTLINEEVNRCLANAPSSDDDYYLVKYIYEYLILNTEYDINAPDNQNICSVFMYGKSVCNGYAKAAQYLFDRMGLECTFVTGTVRTKSGSSERHAWNLVLCNDAYYYVDATWGDASYQSVSGESADASKLPAVNYDYLNVTTRDLTRTHAISDDVTMPMCASMADNYYVREGEYFTSPELSLVKDLFDRRYKDGSKNVTIKCADSNVYRALFDELITQRKVFDYLQGEDTSTVSYTTFEDTGTIMFWL